MTLPKSPMTNSGNSEDRWMSSVGAFLAKPFLSQADDWDLRTLEALSYDAVYMAVEAAEGAKTSKDIAANLAKVKDFEGITGTMTIDASHNPVKSVTMIGLTDGKETSSTVVEAD